MNNSHQDIAQHRGEQLQLLRAIKLDSWTVGKVAVSGTLQKAVLRAIDDRDGGQGCFASQATLATEIGCSRASVGRAIAALIDQDIITKRRPNHWSPNNHRVNWTALCQVNASEKPNVTSMQHGDASTTHDDASMQHGDVGGRYVCSIGELSFSGPLLQGDAQNAPLIANLNATTNRPDEWEAVAVEMFRWGLKTAGQAVDAARSRGLSIEFVQELFHEAGGDREPNRWEPGQLANWLTGKTPPPFDEAGAIRRRETREHASDIAARAAADRIRQSVHAAGTGQPAWLVAGISFRKLQSDGLDRLATDAERAGAARMDEIDRQRELKQTSPEKRHPRIDARSVGRHGVISEPDNPQSVTQRLPQPQRAPRPKSRASVERTRSELLRALGTLS